MSLVVAPSEVKIHLVEIPIFIMVGWFILLYRYQVVDLQVLRFQVAMHQVMQVKLLASILQDRAVILIYL